MFGKRDSVDSECVTTFGGKKRDPGNEVECATAEQDVTVIIMYVTCLHESKSKQYNTLYYEHVIPIVSDLLKIAKNSFPARKNSQKIRSRKTKNRH